MEFSRWFDWVLSSAEIYDYGRYPIKGMGVWLPYGYKLRRNVLRILRDLLDSTGHEEILLPLLIPEPVLAKESEHVRGFENEVYWVTLGGLNSLDINLALRPTSETPLSYMESFWIKSYKQLPKKYYQVVSIFRYETKATRPLLRVREVTTFKEAHTLHESFKDSEQQVKEAIEIYKRFFNELGIPYLISKRPEWDKFAGAVYTIAFDTLLPDGRSLQIGTVHNLGQNFTKAFEVRIQKRNQEMDYAWQTSYGISERAIASLISVHGDAKGLVLPYKLAPIQVVIVPIPAGDEASRNRVMEEVADLQEMLKSSGIRAYADLRDEITPGEKFNIWELKGVPIRIDVGPKELREGRLTIFRRDLRSKESVLREDFVKRVIELGDEIDKELGRKARKRFQQKVLRTSSLEQARKNVEEGGISEIPWCGRKVCADKLSEILGADALGTPLELGEAEPNLKCPVCGGNAFTYLRFARKY